MFKNILISLMMGAAGICSAMELAEKHFAELQAQYRAGQVEQMELLTAEAELLSAKCKLNVSKLSPEECEAMAEKALTLYRQVAQLAEARYKQGLCSYKSVLDARHALLMAEAVTQSKTPEQVANEHLKQQQEYEQFFTQQQQAGVADQVEMLEWQRTLLMKQLFDGTGYPVQAEKIQNEIEQNYAAAEALAQARYKAGIAPCDEVEHIHYERKNFYRNLNMMKLALQSNTTVQMFQEQLRRDAEELKQAYDAIAGNARISPYTKLRHRLVYLLAAKTAER